MGAWLRRFHFGLGGGTRRRRLLVATSASVVALGAILISNALAVHDENFQLDGDVSASTTTTVPPGPDPPAETQLLDWDSLFDADGDEKLPLPSGFDATSFDKDFGNTGTTFSTSDDTTFATGSKDEQSISQRAQHWQCNRDNNVNSKIDIMNAYSASYTASPSGDEILYFGLERNATTGTADVGFWFLKDGTVDCASPGGATDFDGEHTDGDLLVVSEFTGGGGVSTIKVFEWVGDDATGHLNTSPVVSGVDCEAPATPLNDQACATTNKTSDPNNGTITTPWLTATKVDGVGHTLRSSAFFEGGINLTDSGLAGRCFNTFIADTRSSAETSATLFDYSRGELGACTSETVTDPVESDGETPLPDPPAGIGLGPDGSVDVKDQATVTVTGVDDWSGTVTFHLCGPFAINSTTLCNNDPDDPTTQGTQIGSAVPVTDPSPATVTSEAATITEGGRYCWRAEFSGDEEAQVPPSSDSRASECFVITIPTAISTQQRVFPNDSATITSPESGNLPANGTVVFSLYGATTSGTPKTALENCQAHGDTAASGLLYRETRDTGAAAASQTVGTTNGNDPTAPPDVSVDASGTYFWRVTYNPNAASHTGRQSDCVENTVLTFNNDAGPGTPFTPPPGP
jgi:hypothetical protein